MAEIYKNDDTRAFGNAFLTIKLKSETEVAISKAVFQCSDVRKEYENPTFPLIVNLTAEETAKLGNHNTCYLAVYDEYGYKQTCKGSLSFCAINEVVKDE